MRVVNNRVIVIQEKRKNDEVKIGNKGFILDTAFREAWNVVQEGVVHSAPANSDLESGDRVYTHHFVGDKEHIIPVHGINMSWLDYSQIYARKRNEEMKVLNNYIFIEPVTFSHERFKKSASGLILTSKSGGAFVERMGVVKMLSDSCRQAGLSEGDFVLFGKNCEYQINIDGKNLYRMELRDVISIVEDELIIP